MRDPDPLLNSGANAALAIVRRHWCGHGRALSCQQYNNFEHNVYKICLEITVLLWKLLLLLLRPEDSITERVSIKLHNRTQVTSYLCMKAKVTMKTCISHRFKWTYLYVTAIKQISQIYTFMLYCLSSKPETLAQGIRLRPNIKMLSLSMLAVTFNFLAYNVSYLCHCLVQTYH